MTPYNRISKFGGQPLTLEVPCNNCAECKKLSRLMWHFRTFHECKTCTDGLGFILYDTLTYADEHLPHLSDFYDISNTSIKDFSCFNHKHFRNFMKLLRRLLEYKYSGISIRYFVTSEYGTDDRFTHRPHLHLILFVNVLHGDLPNPFDISRKISQCWKYGRTDGLPYKPIEYVRRNIFASPRLGNYCSDISRVCNYVSKYITKDSTFQSTIDKRIEELSSIIDDKTELKKLIRSISMFHRQSQGFGLSYLSELDNDEYRYIYENGACRIKDKDKVVLQIPLPLYYKRKLFYKCVKVDDKYTWIPTETGIRYLYDNIKRNINNTSYQLYNKYLNLDDTKKEIVSRLLNKRCFDDLAVYQLYYKDRTLDLSSIPQLITLPAFCYKKEPVDLPTQIDNIINSLFVNLEDDNYYLRDKENNKLYIPSFDNLFDYKQYDYNRYYRNLLCSEDTFPQFKNFDKILRYLKPSKDEVLSKQATFDFIEDLSKKFKHLYKYGN